MNKKYWLRGLITGAIFWLLMIIFIYWRNVSDGINPEFAIKAVGVVYSPVILVGLLIGWFYGKYRNKIN